MISWLNGKIILKTDKYIVLDVQGVGYKTFLSKETLLRLPVDNSDTEIFTHLFLRENKTVELYGFLSAKELAFFDLLIEVPGVGPKSALAILGEASVEDIERAIASGDDEVLTKVAGIGKKKALKILIELKEKYEGLALVMGEFPQISADVLDVLKKLGYSEKESRDALRNIPLGTDMNLEEKVKAALKILGGK